MGKPRVNIEENRKPIIPLSQVNKPSVLPVTSSTLPSVQIFDKSTIKLDRQIYSRRGFNQAVGIEFEELQKKEDTFSVDQFFQVYDALFFNIPKLGDKSHSAIKRRSNEYIRGFEQIDPKDQVINGLNERIIELENQLVLANQADPEHPFFRNGTLIGEVDSSRVFYMDKGFKRQIPNTNGAFWGTILRVLGYNSADKPDGPRWFPTKVSTKILSQIKTGPDLVEDNFEQSTYIENGELFIGNNVTDDTKDATINNLRTQINSLNRQIEDLQDLLSTTPLGSSVEGDDNTGGVFNNEPTFGGQFGPSFSGTNFFD